jgi:hypothetical protein
MKKQAVAVIAIAILTGVAASPTPPGGIKLLPGYRHTTQVGIDSSVGKISRVGGLTIGYDIAPGDKRHRRPVDVARLATTLSWYREQQVAGRTLVCGLNRDGKTYVVAIPGAGFYAEVRNPEDMADLLLTALTFEDLQHPGRP